jgi:hypothetical protein
LGELASGFKKMEKGKNTEKASFAELDFVFYLQPQKMVKLWKLI